MSFRKQIFHCSDKNLGICALSKVKSALIEMIFGSGAWRQRFLI